MKRERLLILILLGHLALVTCGALGVEFASIRRLKSAGAVLDYYGVLSGAGQGYGFFAPGVWGQIRARFEVIAANGIRRQVPLQTGFSHEADLRVGNIIDQFTEDDDEGSEEFKRSLAASLAGTILGRYPTARSVVVYLDEFVPVSMHDFRLGRRPKWDQVYEAQFKQDTKASSRLVAK